MTPEPTKSTMPSDSQAAEAEASKTVDDLGQQHCDVFTRALFNILSTSIAETTFAQILDGAPLSQNVRNAPRRTYPRTHPVCTQHPELCPGVLDRTRHIRNAFFPQELKFDGRLFHKYQASSPGSRAFKASLVEMVVVATHQIAIVLYNLDLDLGGHKKDLVTWMAPPDDKVFRGIYPDGIIPTLFMNKRYRDFEQYPNGVADIVGYWAEAQIFGGVVLFDRRKPCDREPYEDPDAVFLHSNHKDVTYRIWQLLDTQKNELLDFLLSEKVDIEGDGDAGVICPLPIYPDQKNLIRIDPEDPVNETGIYRDLWERKPLEDKDGDPRTNCTAFNEIDYTSLIDYDRSRTRGCARKMAILERQDPEEVARLDAQIEEEDRAAASRDQE